MADEDPLLLFAAARFAEAPGDPASDAAGSVVSKARLAAAHAGQPRRGDTAVDRLVNAEVKAWSAMTLWDAVRDLVQPFADHPDFRPEWRTTRG